MELRNPDELRAGHRKTVHVKARDGAIFRWVTDFIPTPHRMKQQGVKISVPEHFNFRQQFLDRGRSSAVEEIEPVICRSQLAMLTSDSNLPELRRPLPRTVESALRTPRRRHSSHLLLLPLRLVGMAEARSFPLAARK